MVSSPPSKSSWDKRAWFLSLFLGNFAGLLLFCACYPTSRRFLETAFHYTAFGYYSGDLAALVCLVLGMIVAPAAVSATAKRFYILWGLLPLFTFTVWLVALLVVAVSAVEFSNVWVVMALCWIAASWPLSLIWYRRRNRPKLTIPYSSASLSPGCDS